MRKVCPLGNETAGSVPGLRTGSKRGCPPEVAENRSWVTGSFSASNPTLTKMAVPAARAPSLQPAVSAATARDNSSRCLPVELLTWRPERRSPPGKCFADALAARSRR